MSSVQDCLQEVIELGPRYFIRISAPAGADRTSEWEPAELLAVMQRESPGVLEDHAWTEWSTHPGVGSTCYIHYGSFGSALGHREVPGYGHLVAFELSQKQQTGILAPVVPLSRRMGY